jgi:hypothetical protein
MTSIRNTESGDLEVRVEQDGIIATGLAKSMDQVAVVANLLKASIQREAYQAYVRENKVLPFDDLYFQ